MIQKAGESVENAYYIVTKINAWRYLPVPGLQITASQWTMSG